MAYRVFHDELAGLLAVLEVHGNGVRDRTLVRVVIVARESLVLDACHLGAKPVDAWIGRNFVLIVLGGEAPWISGTATMYWMQ